MRKIMRESFGSSCEKLIKQCEDAAGGDQECFLQLLTERVLDQVTSFYIDNPSKMDQYPDEKDGTKSGSTNQCLNLQDYIKQNIPKRERGSNAQHRTMKPDGEETKTITANVDALPFMLVNNSTRNVVPDSDGDACMNKGKKPIDEKRTKSAKAKGKRKFEGDGESNKERNAKKRRSTPKKVDFAKLGLEPPPGLSQELMDFIEQKGGTDVKLVIMKTLYDTDLRKGHDRLSIPVNQVKDKTSLPEFGQGEEHVDVTVVEPVGLHVNRMTLRYWQSNSQYALTSSWRKVVERNLHVLTVNSIIQVWSFRFNGEWWLLLVKVRDGVADNDEGASTSQTNSELLNAGSDHDCNTRLS